MKVLVTGGAGFIGSAYVRYLISETNDIVMNVDKLTYASNKQSLSSVENHPRYSFSRVDICDSDALEACFDRFQPDLVCHLAAESHVDRSIGSPDAFLNSNITGTFRLLEVSRNYFQKLDESRRDRFRFHHISTDEVYGDLGVASQGKFFNEQSKYCPSSPYSASKAASDHLVEAWGRTYGLPILITHCTNNYGPYQHSEKLIPKVISNALKGKMIPIYGQGTQIRDWLYVDDHVRALYRVAKNALPGSVYNIGGRNELTNLYVVQKICATLDDVIPADCPRADLIQFVKDRPGHDQRYAVDATKIENDLGWSPQESFETGLKKTVDWYVKNTPV